MSHPKAGKRRNASSLSYQGSGYPPNSLRRSRPPVKRRPPTPPSGKKRGGQPGHLRRVRSLVPPEQLRKLVVCKPTHCRQCGGDLQGDDPEPLRHQVAELPPVLPVVDEYQLHRLACPHCRIRACATLPPGVPTEVFGPRLRAVLSVLVGAYRLGKRPVQQLVFPIGGRYLPATERQRAGISDPVLPVPTRRDAGPFPHPTSYGHSSSLNGL